MHQEIDQLSMGDPTDHHSSATLKKLKLKTGTISHPMKLFFATVDSQKHVASSTVINVTLEGLHQKYPSLTDFLSQFRKALEVHTMLHSQERY